jgi:YjbE family integral membrane protein
VELASPEFWMAAAQIVLIGILLSGDNAVIIALACRNLPGQQRKRGIFWGVLGAVGLRAVLTLFAVTLLAVPFVRIAGAILLFWMGIELLVPDSDEGRHDMPARMSLWAALKTIVVADFVMSLGNVVAVAGAARNDMTLVVLGLLVSIPIIAWCSGLVLELMERFPSITTLGGALLGYIGGDMLTRDVALVDWLSAHAAWIERYPAPGLVGASFVAGAAVVIAGMTRANAHAIIEVVSTDEPSAG